MYTINVTCQMDPDATFWEAEARVTLYTSPYLCPMQPVDPPEVRWLRVRRGDGEWQSADETTIALDDYNAWAVELAEDARLDGGY